MVSETVIHIQTVLLKQGKFVLYIDAMCIKEHAIFYIAFRDEKEMKPEWIKLRWHHNHLM